jgi:drug/metabolite transporter (DMT)-like permease
VGFVYVRKFLFSRGINPLTGAASQLIAATAIQAAVTPLKWGTRNSPAACPPASSLSACSAPASHTHVLSPHSDTGVVTAFAVNDVAPVAALIVGVLVLDEPVTWPSGWTFCSTA